MFKRIWRGGKKLYSVVRRAYSSLDAAYEDIKKTRDGLRAADTVMRAKRGQYLTDEEWLQVSMAMSDARSILSRFLDSIKWAKKRVK